MCYLPHTLYMRCWMHWWDFIKEISSILCGVDMNLPKGPITQYHLKCTWHSHSFLWRFGMLSKTTSVGVTFGWFMAKEIGKGISEDKKWNFIYEIKEIGENEGEEKHICTIRKFKEKWRKLKKVEASMIKMLLRISSIFSFSLVLELSFPHSLILLHT